MAPGVSYPFPVNHEAVINELGMENAQLRVSLAVANDQIAQLSAERNAREAETPATETA